MLQSLLPPAHRPGLNFLGACCLLLVFQLPGILRGGSDSPPEVPQEVTNAEKLFVFEVQPLLKARCLPCHGAPGRKIKGELDLSSALKASRGGESGSPLIVPGHPEKSLLYRAITWEDPDLEMPPKENDRLSPDELRSFATWIREGAPWPTDEKITRIRATDWGSSVRGIQVTTSGGLSPDWTNRLYEEDDIWAFRGLKEVKATPPADTTRNPIDTFVDARLNQAGLVPAPRASARELNRRLHLGLTGLLPRPEDADTLTESSSETQFQELVTRLLDSPEYGERMAQHWLDVVRYADTAGFSNDWERPHAWRYRDYVVRAFNQDKPFHRFIVEQIAGDELEDGDPEDTLATGFLRMGPWEHTGMSVAALTRQLWLDDVTNSVGETFLAQPLRCARCHDHKFDPIPTRDYYRVQAVFASTQFSEPEVPLLPVENVAGAKERTERVTRHMAESNLQVLTKLEGDNAFNRIKNKLKKYRELALERFKPRALAVKSEKPQEVHILEGGSLQRPGQSVRPGVLSAVGLGEYPHPEVTDRATGRRLELARWIASDRNPLTARVIVNRVWQWHFGEGIVRSSNNFGKTGDRPSHPELLDFLASWFTENSWSIKKLHRLILSSETYRRSTEHPDPEALALKDPTGRLLARFKPRRLTAEEIRDNALLVSGELSRTRGGPGVFPFIHWEVALQPRHIMGGIAPSYRPDSTPEERNRRTLYTFRYRGLSDPFMDVFNRPGPDLSCERRDETTVAPQALELLNGQFLRDRSLILARRALEAQPEVDFESGARRLFLEILGRQPDPDELQAVVEYLNLGLRLQEQARPEDAEIPQIVERMMIAEQTGQPFRWKEHLALDDLVPDLDPASCSPRTRALAELALVLLNSSEFLHVY